jgi:hypothetical protein
VSTLIERLEFRTIERLLVGHAGSRTFALRLRSAGRLGACAYLLRARLQGDRDGWRDRHDLVAQAPGCANQSHWSVSKRMGELFDSSELARLAIAFGLGPNAGPWRIRVEPERIQVTDPAQFEQLFADDRALRTSASVVLDPTLLDECEAWAARGVFTQTNKAALANYVLTENVQMRARALRVDAMCSRQLGRLGAAKRSATSAIGLLADVDAPLELAAACSEAALSHYYEGDLNQALAYFGAELAALGRVDNAVARARGLSRHSRRVASALLRRDDLRTARSRAREAERYAEEAQDETELAFARIMRLRIEVHRGGARKAMHELAHVALTIPASCPAGVLLARRVHLEAAYLAGEVMMADGLALAIIRDANELGLVREAVATVRLLGFFRRELVLSQVPRTAQQRRDRLDDWSILERCQQRTQRRSEP